MWDFVVNDYTDKTDQFIWTIGRLGDWKYGLFNENKLFPSFMRKNAQLWLNNFDELVGFVISEDCNSGFTVFAKRGCEFLYPEMIRNPDLKGKAYLYCNVWRNLNEVSSFDMLKYEYNRESPCFNPKFDLSLVDENGRHVSSCVAFIDHKNNYAEIEKVCTHNENRNRGFAETIIRECFRRLYKDGIQYAYITGYSNAARNLYGKLGAVKSRNWFSYTLMAR